MHEQEANGDSNGQATGHNRCLLRSQVKVDVLQESLEAEPDTRGI